MRRVPIPRRPQDSGLPGQQEAGGLGGVLSWAKLAAGRLGELDSDDDRISALAAEEAGLAGTVGELADRAHRGAEAGRQAGSRLT